MNKDEILEKFGLKPKDYGIPHIQARPLPKEPFYFDKFLHSFVDYDDYLLFVKLYTPKEYHEDQKIINRALWNAEYLIGTLGLELNSFAVITAIKPDFLTVPIQEFPHIAKIFIEFFYWELPEITEIINSTPEIFKFSYEDLLNKIVDLSHIMQVSRYTIFDLIHKCPKILFYTKEELQNYLTVVAKTFKCHQDDLRNAIFNYPKILDIPLDTIIENYNKVYAKGFTRLELRRMFITNAYNFNTDPDEIIKKVDKIASDENLTNKEAKTVIGDCPFILPLNDPLQHFSTEKALNMRREFLKEWQYDFQFPHQTFLIKYLFARCTAIEMQFSKIVNTDTHKLFARYFYLKEKLGDRCDFSHDLYLPDYSFEKKYNIKTKELIEKYPLKTSYIDRLFDDYNKLDKRILYWFPIKKPSEYFMPPAYYSIDVIKNVFRAVYLPQDRAVYYSFTALGFTQIEIEFFQKTIPNLDKLNIAMISDIYLAFKKFDFTLEETSWILLHNPAIFAYDERALKNRLKMINYHYDLKFFCTVYPERI